MSIYLPFRGRDRFFNQGGDMKTFETPTPSAGWTVASPYDAWWDGKTIVTVGSGRDYEDPETAVEAAADQSLILVDAGSYNTGEIIVTGKRLVVRGLGESPTDVIITQTEDAVFEDQDLTTKGLLIENMKLVGSTNYRRAVNARSDIVVSKCHLYGYYTVNGMSSDGGTWETILKNCYIERGTYHFSQVYRNHFHLIKCQLNGAIAELQAYNSWLTEDYVTSATEEYGYAYGDYYVNPIG